MILGKQVRGIRAMENMSREDFCEISGISLTALDNVENDGPYQKKTHSRILRTIESLGYKLTDKGVEEVDNQIMMVTDFTDVIQDISVTLRKGEIAYFHCADDRRSTDEVIEALNELQEKGIQLRLTYAKGNDYFTTDPKNYRWIDPGFVADSEVEVVYGDRYVLQIDIGEDSHFQIIRNQKLADSRRHRIEKHWFNGEAPSPDLET